ncbi:MAG: acyl-CoA dehydrogenase [Chitinophagaceae bacterium]|nr:acyl-CoA dehydrogenase [Chitinophagaceae bacterium]
MASYTSMDLLKYLIFDVHQVESLFAHERYAHLDAEQTWMILESAKLLADQEMFPFFKEMDTTPATYDGKGGVRTHPQIKKIIQIAAAQNWIGGAAKFEHGGMQLPEMVFNTAHHIFQSANNSTQGYLGLSTGSADLITSFGSQEQINTYTPHIYEGRWQGTMALTEPQAGSSLSDIVTSAKPTTEGYYLVKGQKIFISGGQHDGVENFVHLTLARIEGAPAGVKGISLFIIPKFTPEADSSLRYNDVYCAGDFQKMGQRGYSTTHLSFGDNDDCRGFLVGEPHKGLSYMFQMMNGARISVGQCAASVAMAAYQSSLQYCLERPQGRPAAEKDPSKPPVLIIHHADIQRMLFTQKAITEASLSLVMECNKLYDLVHVSLGEEKDKHLMLLEILTPIVKTYASEQGSRSAALAIQTLGGYGFTTDFPVQQLYRDLKIMSLYEGTTGIQSLDLLGRKVTMQNGKSVKLLFSAISNTILESEAYENLKPYSTSLSAELKRTGEVLQHISLYATKGEIDRYLSDATVFMEMISYIVIAWQWLKMANKAVEKINANDFKANSKIFYEGKIHTMEFFFKYELPHAEACAKTLLDEHELTNIKAFELFN